MACLVLRSSNPQSAPPARASSQTETDGYKHDGGNWFIGLLPFLLFSSLYEYTCDIYIYK